MPALVALQGNAPQIDPVDQFAQGAAAKQSFDANNIVLARKGLENIGSIALGAMGGKLDGQVNPEQFEKGLDMLASSGINVDAFRGRPEVAPIAARASMSALEQLKVAQSEQDYELAMKKFQLDMQKAATAQANGGYDSPEKFSLNPTYYKVKGPDGKDQVLFGTMGDRGTFKPVPLPEGATPAVPVQQLNTETGFQPVTKFGDVPENAPITPINNADAARDTAIGKGQGELQVELPAKKAKAEGALNALERQWVVVGSDIDRAIEQSKTGFPKTGIFSIANAVPGAPGYDLAQTLNTIKANIGFDRLQEMRNNSPTGGALGAISDSENQLLQAVNGALTEGQSQDQLERNLRRVKTLQALVLQERKEAFARDFGGDTPAPTQTINDAMPSGEADWTDYFGDLQ